jgi:hypothetical protein
LHPASLLAGGRTTTQGCCHRDGTVV